MKEKDYNISLLADIYGFLLTKKQLDIIRDYYDYDYSLAELSEKYGIKRQSAYGCILSAKNSLYAIEKNLGLLQKKQAIKSYLRKLEKHVNSGGADIIKRIEDCIDGENK